MAGWTAHEMVAEDGHELVSRRMVPDGPVRGWLVVAPATGVPQGFYRRFAEHAARDGWAVASVDYRGIGESWPRPAAALRELRLDYRDWARLDLAALIRDLDAPVAVVGHSYGGQALGLLPDDVLTRVQAAYAFGSGSGWTGWMPRLEQLRVRLLWSVVGPAVVAATGRLAWSRLGMGEDLPRDVYRQWRRWCGYPRYYFDDPLEQEAMTSAFARPDFPMMFVNSTDDRWIPPAARDAFVSAYTGAEVSTLDVSGVDHMGYFRPGAESLWDQALTWLGARVAA